MRIKLIYSVLLVLLTACTTLRTAPDVVREISRKVESKEFTIAVNYAIPMRMRPVYLTSEYNLMIKNDSTFAYLPYFGVAYSAPYNPSEGGIKFAEPMTDYKITKHQKADGWDICYKVRTKLTVYNFSLNIFNNGSSSITVNSYEKDMINFSGEIK